MKSARPDVNVSSPHIWQFDRIYSLERTKTDLKTEGTAQTQFDFRRLQLSSVM